MNIRALRGLNDPLSVGNEAIYTFYRTLKRWTTGPGGPLGLLLGLPENHEIWSSFSGPDGLILDACASK